jgi:hypothetical protein
MLESIPMPCTDWAQRLAARHQDDLSPADHAALKQHLVCCQACAKVHAAYHAMEVSICSFPGIRPLPGLSYQLSQPMRKVAARKAGPSLRLLVTMGLATLCALFSRISWSKFYQNLQTWILIALTRFPRKIMYVSTDSHYLYAMRSDSGYFLWRQKRFMRYELVSSLPIRCGGMLYAGSGVALASALDFCEYAVRA